MHISGCSRSHLIKTRKIKTSARNLQGTKCYNRITVKGTNNNRKEEMKMFGFTALVATLIISTVVGTGVGFAVVCITE